METDPTNPYDGGGESAPIDTEVLPPDLSWSEFFDGVWRRMTNPLPG